MEPTVKMTFGGKTTDFWRDSAVAMPENIWLQNVLEDLAVMAKDTSATSNYRIADREGGKVLIYTERITMYRSNGKLYYKVKDHSETLLDWLDDQFVDYSIGLSDSYTVVIIQNRY